MPYAEFIGAKVGKAPVGYSKGRPYGPCIWVVIHTTDGSETATSAEDGNAYDARRADSVSTHVFVDSDSVVQEVNSGDRAWAALNVANNRGYQVELCGVARQTAAQWSDGSSVAELVLAAQHVARVCLKLGISAKWLTKADVDARRTGIITHKNVTDWLEGTHTDPGPNFPYSAFMGQVAHWKAVYSAPIPAPVPDKPSVLTGEADVKLFTIKGSPAIYKTDGISGWHIETMAEVNTLNTLFGPTVTVKQWPSSVKLVSDTPAAIRQAAPIGLLPDDTADDEGIRSQHP